MTPRSASVGAIAARSAYMRVSSSSLLSMRLSALSVPLWTNTQRQTSPRDVSGPDGTEAPSSLRRAAQRSACRLSVSARPSKRLRRPSFDLALRQCRNRFGGWHVPFAEREPASPRMNLDWSSMLHRLPRASNSGHVRALFSMLTRPVEGVSEGVEFSCSVRHGVQRSETKMHRHPPCHACSGRSCQRPIHPQS